MPHCDGACAQVPFPVSVIHHSQVGRPISIVGANTDIICAFTSPKEPPAPRSDGWWGPHEYTIVPQHYDKSSPYLAWIPTPAAYADPNFSRYTHLDPTLALLSFHTHPLIADPIDADHTHAPTSGIIGLPPKPQGVDVSRHRPSFVSTSAEMQALVKEKVMNLKSLAHHAFKTLEEYPELSSIRIPDQALFRLEQAYFWILLPGTVTVSGHILVLGGLKRAVYELHGFLLWLKDVTHHAKSFRAGSLVSKSYKTRGSIVDDAETYCTLFRFGIPVYMLVDTATITLQRLTRTVSVAPVPISRHFLFPHGSHTSGHHTYIYFYPPVVEDPVLFELSARGYASRLDVYTPNKDIDRLHARMVKDAKIAQGIYFPYVKCRIHHLRQQAEEEYVGIQTFSPIPPLFQWSSARQQMEWPPAFQGPGCPPAVVTATPPPLLFFRCSNAEKQQSFFFIWACIRRTWLQSLVDTPYDSPYRRQFYLTHQEWRQILSGERFKKAARKSGLEFALRHFWRLDPFLWDDGSVPQDISPILHDQTRLTPDHFLENGAHSFDLKRVLCYDIALTHMAFQFEETDEIVMKEKHIDANALADRRCRRSTLFRDSLKLLRETPPWQSTDVGVKSAWFEEFRMFLRDWPRIYTSQPCSSCDAPLTSLDEPALSHEIASLLQIYYTAVLRNLNVIPTLMWTFPGDRGWLAMNI